MNGLYRILGAAAAVAVGGIAIAAVNKLLNKDAPLYVESVEFPEKAEDDPEAAAETAQAYADAVRAQDAPQGAEAADAQAVQAGAETAPAEDRQPAAETPAAPAQTDGLNPNPVEAAPAQAPKDADGKFDATKIASPEDFANWEDMGCQG